MLIMPSTRRLSCIWCVNAAGSYHFQAFCELTTQPFMVLATNRSSFSTDVVLSTERRECISYFQTDVRVMVKHFFVHPKSSSDHPQPKGATIRRSSQ